MIRPLILSLMLVVAATAADKPSPEEWEPIRQALAADAPDAATRLEALNQRYPVWGDGPRLLAGLLLRRNQPAEAYAAAVSALKIDSTDAEAGACACQALNTLGKFDKTLLVSERFSGEKDRQGWISYHGAHAALRLGDAARADILLKLARTRAGEPAPAEFAFLESRVALALGDAARAETSLRRAVEARADFFAAWYELGRIQVVLAQRAKEGRTRLLQEAERSFRTVLNTHPEDARALLGAGKATFEQGLVRADEGDANGAGSSYRDAVGLLTRGLEKLPDDRDGHLWLGDALFRLQRWQECIPHLQKARELKASDRALPYNLAAALGSAGRIDEAKAVLATLQAETPAEQLVMAMNAYKGGNHDLAAQMLGSVIPRLAADDEEGRVRVASARRYRGHALRQLAAADPAQRERLLDEAAAEYRVAGQMADQDARRWYLAGELPRSPERAYQAGWQWLSWSSWLAPGAWGTVIANYGHAATGGKGLGGMWERKPAHVVLWAVLALAPLAWFAIRLLRKPAPVAEPAPPRPAAPARRPGTGAQGRPGAAVPAPSRPTPRPEKGALEPKRPAPAPGQGSAAARRGVRR